MQFRLPKSLQRGNGINIFYLLDNLFYLKLIQIEANSITFAASLRGAERLRTYPLNLIWIMPAKGR
jgi:hypothetical protein